MVSGLHKRAGGSWDALLKTARIHLILLSCLFLSASVWAGRIDNYRSQQAFRFTRPLNEIEKIFKSAKTLDDVLPVLAKDGRGWAFSLEGLAKIYSDAYPDELDSIYKFSKKFEDEVGWYGDALAHIDFANELDWKTPDGKPPKELMDLLEKERAKRADYLKSILIRDRWVEVDGNGNIVQGKNPRIDLIQKKVDSIDWHGLNQDRIDVIEGLYNHIKEKLVKKKYNLNVLQNGLHDLRRQIRWPMIWFQEVHGAFAGTNKRIDGMEGIKRDKKVVQNPFSKLPKVSAKYPILIPRTAIYWLRKLAGDLGDLKDMGEASHEWLYHALKEINYSEPGVKGPKALAERLVQTHPKYTDPEKVKAKVDSVMKESELFPTLKKSLKKQLDWSKRKCQDKFAEIQ